MNSPAPSTSPPVATAPGATSAPVGDLAIALARQILASRALPNQRYRGNRWPKLLQLKEAQLALVISWLLNPQFTYAKISSNIRFHFGIALTNQSLHSFRTRHISPLIVEANGHTSRVLFATEDWEVLLRSKKQTAA